MVSLSADVNRVESWAVEFLVNHTKLVQVAADGGGNISVLAYDKQVWLWGRGGEGEWGSDNNDLSSPCRSRHTCRGRGPGSRLK
jgi:hypothetical protein